MSLDWSLNCEHCGERSFDANITHNVADMWRAAGCYGPLYEWEGRKAKDALSILRSALAMMQDEPAKFQAMNPDNGWGSYEDAKKWLSAAIDACAAQPESLIHVWA